MFERLHNIEIRVGEQWSSALLNNVSYVSETRHQLFSMRQTVKHRNDVIFYHNGMKIRRSGKLIATGMFLGPEYVLKMRVMSQIHQWKLTLLELKKCSMDGTNVWAIPLSPVGLSVKCSDTGSFCDGCVLGKSKRKQFRSQTFGELINADVNG